jgi:hypothetical protein
VTFCRKSIPACGGLQSQTAERHVSK